MTFLFFFFYDYLFFHFSIFISVFEEPNSTIFTVISRCLSYLVKAVELLNTFPKVLELCALRKKKVGGGEAYLMKSVSEHQSHLFEDIIPISHRKILVEYILGINLR